MDFSQEQFEKIARMFCRGGVIRSVELISNGNINTTYDVTVEENGEERRYVFQKLNLFVFKSPRRIMSNIERVTEHIAGKLAEMGKSRDHVMHFLYTEEGKNFYIDGQSFWRVSEYVSNSVAINSCEDPAKLREAGRAFGEFQTMLADFDAALLFETIPKFHDTRSRIAVLMRHVKEDPCGRADEIRSEIERISALRSTATKLNELVDSQELPLRVTHNDTKINNVLFDQDTGEAKTVIDLDTVMPGLVAHDFGDAIRYAANRSAEDEADLSLVGLDMEKFRAFAEGFIPQIASSLTDMELRTMALGAFTMTLELAVRFLDDYLTGDQYFKTLYQGHNLVRARCQLTLAEDMFGKLDEMNRMISEISGLSF